MSLNNGLIGRKPEQRLNYENEFFPQFVLIFKFFLKNIVVLQEIK